MAPRIDTRDLVDRIDQHPDLYGRVTIDSARSLPVLVNGDGPDRPALAVFWYPAGGAVDERLVYPPYFGATIPTDGSRAPTFAVLDPTSLGIRQPSSQPLGPVSIGDVASMEEYEQEEAQLYGSLDQLAPHYLRSPATLSGAERAAARAYLTAFNKLAHTVLHDTYRARSPDFFAWVDAAATR